ncbi:putative vesicular transport protein [Trypanosoma cruzi Dm28c]|uniref:Putative vesicular transport protein n=1 Tax=Trypanosoma cruzi Dm28c TaxID=1416333 RepID=V5BHN7_TRYCR|nr:putative vesicular transport protein [Trypanosoma cruzi Dm28c]
MWWFFESLFFFCCRPRFSLTFRPSGMTTSSAISLQDNSNNKIKGIRMTRPFLLLFFIFHRREEPKFCGGRFFSLLFVKWW